MVPPLAGRSPSYSVRQLYDIQYGFRRGPAMVPMKPEVAHLNAKDRIAIAAHLASLRSQERLERAKKALAAACRSALASGLGWLIRLNAHVNCSGYRLRCGGWRHTRCRT